MAASKLNGQKLRLGKVAIEFFEVFSSFSSKLQTKTM